MLVKVVEKTGVFIKIVVYTDRGVLHTVTKTGFCVKYLGKFTKDFQPVK